MDRIRSVELGFWSSRHNHHAGDFYQWWHVQGEQVANTSTSLDIDQLQLEAYRKMTGEERLRIGLGLYEASVGIAREAIRGRFPNADEEFIEEKLRRRIRLGYEIETSQKSPSPPAPLPMNEARGAGQVS
jgi:hypothetical protein